MKNYVDLEVVKPRDISHGQAGAIYRCQNIRNKQKYIRKEYALDENNPLDRAKQEGETMKLFNYKYINGFVDAFQSSKTTYSIIMEMCEKTLRDVIEEHQKQGKLLPLDEAIKYFLMIAMGVGYIHRNGLFHRELTPDNIFIAKDKTIRIGDLGWAIKFDKDNPTNEYIGTSNLYAPLECLDNAEYGPKVDIWALGVIFYELLTCEYPFKDESGEEDDGLGFYYLIRDGFRPDLKEKRPEVPDEIVDLYTKLLEEYPENRPDIIEFLQENAFLKKKAVENGFAFDYSMISEKPVGNVDAGKQEIKKVKDYLINKCKIPKKYFDDHYDGMTGSFAKENERVGELEYYPPNGWFGIGLNLEEIFPDLDDDDPWLGAGRTNVEGTWPIIYHGLRKNNAARLPVKDIIKGILEGGTLKGTSMDLTKDECLLHPGEKVKPGVTCYSKLEDMIKWRNVTDDGNGYMFVFMCRAKYDTICQPKAHPFLMVCAQGQEGIRPYRLLFKNLNKK